MSSGVKSDDFDGQVTEHPLPINRLAKLLFRYISKFLKKCGGVSSS